MLCLRKIKLFTEFYWLCDSHIDKKAVFRKIRQFPESFCYQSESFNANDNSLLQYFHVLNADKEGNADIILYDGFCKPYPRVEIWLYRDRKSDKIYSQAGYIAELGKHDELHEIVVKKDGCCCDSESVIEYVTLNNMTNSVVVKERVTYTADILIPDFTFFKKIRVASDKGILRNNPVKDDTLRTWECNDDFLVKGNILAEYLINTKGVALAKTENRKIIWFFVVIYADSDSYPYHGKIKYPISKHSVSFGWMNSDLLKVR